MKLCEDLIKALEIVTVYTELESSHLGSTCKSLLTIDADTHHHVESRSRPCSREPVIILNLLDQIYEGIKKITPMSPDSSSTSSFLSSHISEISLDRKFNQILSEQHSDDAYADAGSSRALPLESRGKKCEQPEKSVAICRNEEDLENQTAKLLSLIKFQYKDQIDSQKWDRGTTIDGCVSGRNPESQAFASEPGVLFTRPPLKSRKESKLQAKLDSPFQKLSSPNIHDNLINVTIILSLISTISIVHIFLQDQSYDSSTFKGPNIAFNPYWSPIHSIDDDTGSVNSLTFDLESDNFDLYDDQEDQNSSMIQKGKEQIEFSSSLHVSNDELISQDLFKIDRVSFTCLLQDVMVKQNRILFDHLQRASSILENLFSIDSTLGKILFVNLDEGKIDEKATILLSRCNRILRSGRFSSLSTPDSEAANTEKESSPESDGFDHRQHLTFQFSNIPERTAASCYDLPIKKKADTSDSKSSKFESDESGNSVILGLRNIVIFKEFDQEKITNKFGSSHSVCSFVSNQDSFSD